MAIITDVGALDMSGGFAAGNLVVMATETGAGDREMINSRHRFPVSCAVAIIAVIAALDVTIVFPCRGAAIMTTEAGADGDAAVIESCAGPGRSCMAITAVCCRR